LLLTGLKIVKEKKEREKLHSDVGAHNSAHSKAQQKCEYLLNKKQNILILFLQTIRLAEIGI
jgi:hypothetical protein